jgi:hypothetical protein
MNKRLKTLMLEAGYAAPEIAGRANRLADLIVKECAKQIDVYKMMKLDPSFYGGMLRDHFKDKENNDGQV